MQSDVVTKMNPEVKAKWIEALRDPEAQQVKGYLNEPGEGMCCLGVLTELAIADGVDLEKEVVERGNYEEEEKRKVVMYDGYMTQALPHPVVEWAGLDRDSVVIPVRAEGGQRVTHLSDLNDNGKTFAEIADLVEEYL